MRGIWEKTQTKEFGPWFEYASLYCTGKPNHHPFI